MSRKIHAIVMSLKPVKLNPVIEALRLHGHNAQVDGEKVEIAGDPEQPFGVQTWIAANNRMNAGQDLYPNADMIVTIENGIFQEGAVIKDRAIVGVRYWQQNAARPIEIWGVSDGVIFPTEYVEEARRIGFDKMTVGKVMAGSQATGGLSTLPAIVAAHDDPHFSLTKPSKSRALFIAETVNGAIAQLRF